MLLSKVKSSFILSLDNPLHILKTSIIKILPIPSIACLQDNTPVTEHISKLIFSVNNERHVYGKRN